MSEQEIDRLIRECAASAANLIHARSVVCRTNPSGVAMVIRNSATPLRSRLLELERERAGMAELLERLVEAHDKSKIVGMIGPNMGGLPAEARALLARIKGETA